MTLTGELSFGHEDRKRIYEYVERRGTTTEDEVRDALHLDPRGVRHHVAILKRDGLLRHEGDELSVGFHVGETEDHRADGVEYSIRPARQDDFSGLVGAIRRVAEQGRYIEAESVADVIDHEEVLLRHDDLESRMFFVATVGNEVVGWVHVHAPEVEKLSHTAELTVGVLEEYRGHGIGSQLLERGLDWATEEGYEKIYNSVPATNEAGIDYLEDHGWDVETVREDHYLIDGEYVDEVMLAVTLPQEE